MESSPTTPGQARRCPGCGCRVTAPNATDGLKNPSRRRMITGSAAALGAGALLLNNSLVPGADTQASADADRPTTKVNGPFPPGEPGKDYTPVITPNGV